MKYGPCNQCLIRPVCSILCNDKIYHLTLEASIEVNKSCQDVTLEEFLKQLRKEGMKIRKIEVVDGSV